MKSTISDVQKKIKVGTHGEDYGSWMSNPVFYVFGGIALVTLVLTALSFTVFRIPHHGFGRCVRRSHRDSGGTAVLDGVDPLPVRLRQRRHDGKGASDNSEQP